ncbi:hypothetical protein MTR67_033922 [Solanum verrucosum]|uniref:non-specific serine/threonine protein kinase n=1 Tax=Solanum verrucosum TaxID=315347 RepID=A0AAF0U752_SOLVR|nr:hypothetical protein MTR67_033922 [Solanum verrucosum]
MENKTDGNNESLVLSSKELRLRCIIKERFSKKYRHPTLDLKLILKGLNAEARCVTKARRLGVATPVLYVVDPVMHTLTYEYIEGPSVKDIFLGFGLVGVDEELMVDIATQIGNAIGKLHDGGLVHGDLTTSNMLLRSAANQLVLIDFGLSFTSTLPEDKAVDLYVLERALLSMHSSCGDVMDRILAAYRKSSKQWSSTLNRLAQGAADSFEAKRKKTHNAWLSFPNSALHVKRREKRQMPCPMGKGETKKLAHCKDQFVFVSVLIIVDVTDAVTYLNLYVYDSLYFSSTLRIVARDDPFSDISGRNDPDDSAQEEIYGKAHPQLAKQH